MAAALPWYPSHFRFLEFLPFDNQPPRSDLSRFGVNPLWMRYSTAHSWHGPFIAEFSWLDRRALPSFHTRTDDLTIMNAHKRKRLEAAGWKFGSVAEFLDVTSEEEAGVESKLLSRERLLK